MTASPRHALIIPRWHYSCTSCGKCCRLWHVAVSPSERQRLEALPWERAGGRPDRFITRVGGHQYLAHRPDGSCIFLDVETNLCIIHRHFGFDAKPIGCRVYPFNIATALPDRISMICRFDCPAVRADQGAVVTASRDTVRGYAAELALDPSRVDEQDLAGLRPEVVEAVSDALRTELDADGPQGLRMVRLALLGHRLESLTADFLNDMEVTELLPSIRRRSAEDATLLMQRSSGVGTVAGLAMMALLVGYLRRDEEVLRVGGLAPRLARTRAIAGLMLGVGTLRGLGAEHPDCGLTRRELLKAPIVDLDAVDWSLFNALIRLRLESFQFFGSTFYHRGFFRGLRALTVTFPLCVAAAKWSALARNPEQCRILPRDIDYAVGAIDHSHGRSAYLAQGLFLKLVNWLGEPEMYAKLVRGLLH